MAGHPAEAAARELSPFPAVGTQAAELGSAEPLTEGSLAVAPQTELMPGQALGIDAIRQEIVSALSGAGHVSAAQLLASGSWRLDSAAVHVTVPGMGKKMIALTVNAAAEKIVRQELQRLGAPARFLLAPGDATMTSAAAEPPAPAGSVQEAALQHPMVKRAQEIFKAEARSVVDLRQK